MERRYQNTLVLRVVLFLLLIVITAGTPPIRENRQFKILLENNKQEIY